MKRIALVFLIAILIPSLLLAWLAIRSVRDQEVVINNQKGLVHQSTCDTLAADINLFMDDVRIFYGRVLDDLVAEKGPELIQDFGEEITENWSQAAAGAVVSDGGEISSPKQEKGSKAVTFLQNHADFLTNSRVVEVYQAPQVLNRQLEIVEDKQPRTSSFRGVEALFTKTRPTAAPQEMDAAAESERQLTKKVAPKNEPAAAAAELADQTVIPSEEAQQKWKVSISQNRSRDFRFEKPGAEADFSPQTSPRDAAPVGQMQSRSRNGAVGLLPGEINQQADSFRSTLSPESSQQQGQIDQVRNVAPSQAVAYSKQQQSGELEAMSQSEEGFYNISRLNLEAVWQNDLTAKSDEGAVSRIIGGDLHVLLWKQHESIPGYTFWTELDLGSIREDLGALFSGGALPGQEEVSIALLDSSGDLVTQTESGFSTDWSRPFVAAEVGQILPRWEVAAYLLNPEALSESARTVRLTLWLIVLVLVGAVGVGSLLILRSVDYEMRLAAQKTDFVSNVSHELKTPLTSIRMFSELLAGAKQHDSERTRNYSEVISKESARLTRLINRLLDFSRLDRGELQLQESEVDLVQLARETVEHYRPQIEAEGLEIALEVNEGEPLRVLGDRDALSQVILNLFSNAEKYAAEGGEILLEVKPGESEKAVIAVHDRGNGISQAHRRRIFEKFYRVDESIRSGIEGSGIGLALCRQIAEKHGGDIQYMKREGGGSSFFVTLPLANSEQT